MGQDIQQQGARRCQETGTAAASFPGTALFEEKVVLTRQRPPSFEDHAVIAFRTPEGNLDFAPQPGKRTWLEMQAARKGAKAAQLSPHDMDVALRSDQGFTLSNLGISLLVTVPIGDRQFLMTVRQERPDFGDVVAKNPSGYVNTQGAPDQRLLIEHLRRSGLTEVTEEALVWRASIAALLHGAIKTSAEVAARELIVRANDELILGDVSSGTALLKPAYAEFLPYVDSNPWQLELGGERLKVSASPADISVSFAGVRAFETTAYFSKMWGSGQIVQRCTLRLSNCHDLSLSHVEQLPPGADGLMPLQYQRDGALLLEIRDGYLTGDSFYLRNGNLESAMRPDQVVLSEAFVPSCFNAQGDATGIVTRGNIPLPEYLKLQDAHRAGRREFFSAVQHSEEHAPN